MLTWWTNASPFKTYNGIIADGSIRSGKTLGMSVSYMLWAMASFNGQQFIMSGKTVSSFRRNVLFWVLPFIRLRGFKIRQQRDENIIIISKRTKDRGLVENYFHIFGGRDESSQDLVQGMTAAGALFDEVALMPESFVNQAVGRCSVEDAKLWFNCNPDKPKHFFKLEWIDKADEKKLLHLHFIMDDNPSLSESMKQKYRTMFVGIFFKRYILGLWELAEGVIYSMFNDNNLYKELSESIKWKARRYITIDYGTTNPMAMYNVYDDGNISYVDDEYYFDSKKAGRQKTDSEYAEDLIEFIKREPQHVIRIILDPSAASFKAELRKRGYLVKDANNEVLEGIRMTSSAFFQQILKVNEDNCPNLIKEIGGYIWDAKARDRGSEQPVKTDDHGCITGNTLIETTKGKKTMKELVGTKGKLYCINTKTRRKAIGNYYDVRCTGKHKPVYRIKLSNGKYIEATGDHKVLTKRGWKTVDELTLADKVVKINYVK